MQVDQVLSNLLLDLDGQELLDEVLHLLEVVVVVLDAIVYLLELSLLLSKILVVQVHTELVSG